MRAVLQRVCSASVSIGGEKHASIEAGFLILLGIEEDDNSEDISWLVRKIVGMRIFPDDDGNMNHALDSLHHQILLISQFTLHASTKKGNRPSFIRSAKPDFAIPLYNQFISELKSTTDCKVCTGEFGADMKVSLVNDGPVTILLDSKNKE